MSNPLESIHTLAKAALGPEWISFGDMISTLERIVEITEEAERQEVLARDRLADERRGYHTPNP